MSWFHAARARLRLLAPRAAESRFDSEIGFHIEMETERLAREQQLDHQRDQRHEEDPVRHSPQHCLRRQPERGLEDVGVGSPLSDDATNRAISSTVRSITSRS